MVEQCTEAPIFDANQHMYETPESLTRYLPEKFHRSVQFVQGGYRRGAGVTADLGPW